MKPLVNLIILLLILYSTTNLKVLGYNLNLPDTVEYYEILSICTDNKNNVYLSTSDGIYFNESNVWKYTKNDKLFKEEKKINQCDLKFDENGRLWVANWHGIGFYYNGKWSNIRLPNRIKKNVINAIAVKNENIWIGTNNGVWRKRMIGWKHFELYEFGYNRITDIEIDEKGILWASIGVCENSDPIICTEGAIAYYYDNNWQFINLDYERLNMDTDYFYTISDKMIDSIMLSYKNLSLIKVDSNFNIITLNSNNDFNTYSPNKFAIGNDNINEFYKKHESTQTFILGSVIGPGYKYMENIEIDSQNNVWILNSNNQLFKIKDTQVEEFYFFMNNMITTFTINKDDMIYIIGEKQLIYNDAKFKIITCPNTQ